MICWRKLELYFKYLICHILLLHWFSILPLPLADFAVWSCFDEFDEILLMFVQFSSIVIKLKQSPYFYIVIPLWIGWFIFQLPFLFLFCLISGLWCSILWLRIVKGRLLILSSLYVKYLGSGNYFVEVVDFEMLFQLYVDVLPD